MGQNAIYLQKKIFAKCIGFAKKIFILKYSKKGLRSY